MIGPRDKDLRAIYDELYADDDNDPFSKRSDLRSRIEFASRFTRGNVEMQNSGIALLDFDQKLSGEVSRLLRSLKKFE
ncbi:MAG: hypothetical protein ABGX47_00585 [Martelella sp.]|uniref:hypothetical protein n=1 Tax=Martelella sp. TaxID=1969699 RepID=UPI003242E724